MHSRFPAVVTYTSRFIESLGVLCSQTPEPAMCRACLESEDESLQEWVLEHMRVDWVMGIGTTDAARFLADQVEEGRPELVTHGVERLLRHLAASPLPMRKRGNSLTAKTLPAGVTREDVADALTMNMAALAGDGALHLTPYYDFTSVQG